jgi:hypothetical protein
MPRIGIILTSFYRQRVLEICFAGIDRLRADCQEYLPVICVGEEDEKTLDLCDHYDIEHHYAPNRPLTEKYNLACQLMKGKCDNVMILGSDNLITNRTFNAISAETEKGIDLIGLDDVYFFGMDDEFTGKLLYFGYTQVLGVGRTVSARVLDKINWTPWGRPADRGIDRVMLETVNPHVETRSLLSGYHVFDLKSSQNLNPMRSWAQRKRFLADTDIFWEQLSPAEINLIKQYIEQ